MPSLEAMASLLIKEENIMQSDFVIATLFNLVLNLIYTVIALIIGILALKFIDKNLLSIPSVINQDIEDELFTILATSYGLSIPLENEIVLTPIENVFDHIEAPESNPWDDYGYEHGLSDI